MASGKRGAKTQKKAFRGVLPRFKDRLIMRGGLEVSPFCLGMVSDPRAVSAAFDLGINFFFCTADMHWPHYDGLRRGLVDLLARGGGIRDQIVVAVVAYVTQPEFFHAPFQEAIDAIPGLGRIDVTVAGGSYRSDFEVRLAQSKFHGPLGARAFGVSFHERKAAAAALRDKKIDVGFVRYNVFHRGAEKDLFPHVPAPRSAQAGASPKKGRPLLFNFTSTHGFLRPEHYAKLGLSSDHWQPAVTDYYRFALANREIDGLLCAPRSPAQLESMDAALAAGPLTEEERLYLRDLADLAMGTATLA